MSSVRSFVRNLAAFPRPLAAFALVSVFFSLAWRLAYRREYYVGWELLGPAHGQFLFSTTAPWEAMSSVFNSSRHFWYWNNSNSLIYTVVAGNASRLIPGEYWATAVTFGLVSAALWFAMKAAGLGWRQIWLVLLAWGASPTLLSFSLSGHAFAAAILPHAIALAMVLSSALNKSLWKTVTLGALAIEMSWQLYEAGRLMFLVWVLAALFLRDISRPVRAAWITLSVVQVVMLAHYRSASTFFLDNLPARLGFRSLSAAGALLIDRLFVHPTLTLPLLFALALATLFLLRENRAFWISLFAVNIGMVLLLALRGPLDLYSRRFNVMEFYSITLVLTLLSGYARKETSHLPKYLGPVFLGLLTLGNLTQIGAMAYHFRTPVAQNEHPLPFSWSRHDLKVNADHVAFVNEVQKSIEDGKRAIVLYNFSSGGEWLTDPAAVPERLYLRLGHRRFIETVYMFGKDTCRYDCLPIHRPQELPAVLEQIATGRLGAIESFAVYSLPSDPAKDLVEAEQEIRKVFETTEDQVLGKSRVFRLRARRTAPLTAPVVTATPLTSRALSTR